MKHYKLTLFAAVFSTSVYAAQAQTAGQPAPDHPAVTVPGQTYTPRSILARNMGTPEDQATQFPPHKIIGNIYYVGTKTLSSFLIITPQGNILIDSTYERNVPVIQKSVADLGFKFSDIKILLGNHAHGDHQEGDAKVKELTGAQVVAMAEDVDTLKAIKPGGREHPIDRTFKVARALPCDVPLGDHGAQYGMQEKYAKLKAGGPNPFIDKANCNL